MHLHVWTDGSGDTRPPNIGGWAVVIRAIDNPFIEEEISGAEYGTTSQRMEITAFLKALEWPVIACDFTVHCDSAYVANTIKLGWIGGWVRSGWVKAGGEPVKNRDLWEQAAELLAFHNSVTMVKVKGHSDVKLNNRADVLAGAARKHEWSRRNKGLV